MTTFVSTLVMVYSLLAVATPASAEGAWVLWVDRTVWVRDTKTGQGSIDQQWDVIKAFPGSRDCEDWRTVTVDLVRDEWETRKLALNVDGVEATSETVKITFKAKGESLSGWTLRYICLPDTVDPRGPKEPRKP